MPSAARCSRSSRARSPWRRVRAGGTPTETLAGAGDPEGARRVDAEGQHRARVAKGTGADSDADAFEAVLYEGTARAGWRSSSRRSPTTATAPGLRCGTLHQARRQPGRARLGGVDLREEGRDRGGRLALLGGRPPGWRSTRVPRTSHWTAILGDRDGSHRATAVREAIEAAGVEIDSAELVQRPTTRTRSRRTGWARCCACSTRSRRTTTCRAYTRTSTWTPRCSSEWPPS